MAYKKAKLWFDEDLADLLSEKIRGEYAHFDKTNFVKAIAQGVDTLELKARLNLFSDCLKKYLPDDYEKAIQIMLACLGEENLEETGMFTEFYWLMPFATFVEKHGLNDLDLSLKAIAEITKRNTGEFAIRPYLERYPNKAFAQMLEWSTDENFHLRRLASEGSRPRLPWAKKLDVVIKNPDLSLAILDNLKDDSLKFVQKSVANHINDMLKDNYAFAMELLNDWAEEATKERKWIMKHDLRRERRHANPDAQSLLEGL